MTDNTESGGEVLPTVDDEAVAAETVAESTESTQPNLVADEPGPDDPPAAAAPVEPLPANDEASAGETSEGDGSTSGDHVESVAVPEAKSITDAAEIVTGVVTSVSGDEVDVALRDGRPAVIYRREIDENASDPTTVFKIGDRAEGAVLLRDDPKGRVVLSRVWALKQIRWQRILDAHAASEVVEATVTAVSGKGVVVDVGVRGFVPASHLELEPVADLSAYVGQTLSFKVLEVDPRRERLVLSRRSILMRDQRRRAHDAMAGLEVGSVVTGKVQSIVDYGTFVDIGGVVGLVHLSECSWKRLRRASEVVSVGDEVSVKVLDVKMKKRRVSLSIRQVEADPLDALEVGTVVEGPVTRLAEFGAFVDVGNIEGLVHITELSEYRVSVPEEVVTPGENVRVKILGIDPKRRRIELSVRQAVSSPFD